jgi:hypothetical protein
LETTDNSLPWEKDLFVVGGPLKEEEEELDSVEVERGTFDAEEEVGLGIVGKRISLEGSWAEDSFMKLSKPEKVKSRLGLESLIPFSSKTGTETAEAFRLWRLLGVLVVSNIVSEALRPRPIKVVVKDILLRSFPVNVIQ